MSWRAVAGALTQDGRWVYLFYAMTAGAIAASFVSLSTLEAGSAGAWVYLLLALMLLAKGLLWGRKTNKPGHWLWVLLSCVAAGIAFSGGLYSPYYPLIYLFWVAAPAWLDSRRRLAFLGLGHLGLQLALWCAQDSAPWGLVLKQIAFAGLFWGVHRIALGGYLKWLRKEQQSKLAEQARAFVQDAQDFRLDPSRDALDVQRGSVASIHSTIEFELELLRESLGLHGVFLLWPVQEDGQTGWTVKAHRSDLAPALEQVLPNSGFLASLQKGEGLLCLQGAQTRRHTFYYQDASAAIQSLCAVAMRDQGELQGVLLADKTQAEPFSSAQVGIVQRAAEHLSRCLRQERAFAQVERQKQVHAQLHAASVRLSQALGMAQLQQSSLEALSLLLPNELALLFSVKADGSQALALVAQRAGGPLPAQWQSCLASWSGKSRRQSEAGIVGSARKNRVRVMPKRPQESREGLCVFGDDARMMGVGSVLALPLVHADHCDGVVVLLSQEPERFSAQGLSSAGILVHQIGAAMQNANLYDQMQRQATTDGLTGLANHRTFQARLEECVAQVRRTPQPLSVILTDIDHFKSVNDTHGHPVGDEVLRQVAGILERVARKNDLVARYGGEEFVLLLPGSDVQAAQSLAERLRKEVAEQPMQAKTGSFQVTLSLGIAQWQGESDSRQALIDRADQALYACKGSGRNCVRVSAG